MYPTTSFSKDTQKRVLQEITLDLRWCIEIRRSTEAANSQLRTFSASKSEDVHGVKDKQQLQKRPFDKSEKNRKSARKLEKKQMSRMESHMC